MTDFTVHGIIGSPYVRAALLGLEEKGCDYRVAPIGMGDHRKPAFRSLHPFGRIPVPSITATSGSMETQAHPALSRPPHPRPAAHTDRLQVGGADEPGHRCDRQLSHG